MRSGCAGRRGERGAGSVLAVGLLGAVVLAAAAALFALGALVAQQEVQNAADAAALAAADTLSGRSSGYPCDNAARAARLDGASVTRCSTDGPVAAVTAARSWAQLGLTARARAGPPSAAPASGSGRLMVARGAGFAGSCSGADALGRRRGRRLWETAQSKSAPR
ncbi:MAG TPA: Rv3654c family TadE-like protein [Gryllotalpicola sp.]